MNLDELTRLYDFSGTSIVITGGTGILGGEIACALAGCGAKVALLDRRTEPAQGLLDRMGAGASRAIVAEADVLDEKSLRRAADLILERFGSIDALVNGAGGNRPEATTGPNKAFFDLPVDALRWVFELNILGTILPSQVFGRVMAETGRGNILNVSSMNAFRPLTRIAAYSAAKAGVSNFTQWLAVHMAQEFSPSHPRQCDRARLLPDRAESIPPHRTGERRIDGPGQGDHLAHADGSIRQAGGHPRRRVVAAVSGLGLRHRHRAPDRRRFLGLQRGVAVSIVPASAAPAVLGQGSVDRDLSPADVRRIVSEGLTSLPLDGKRLLVIIPDATRTMPMPMMWEAIEDAVAQRVAALDFLIALGTHQPLSDGQMSRLVGRPVVAGRCGARRVFNHRWDDPATFVTLGTIRSAEMAVLTGGLLARDVEVAVNRLILDYDQLLICGPVFPHEVAGFSGGTKYVVPGIAGPDIINVTHWLGALIGNYHVIGEPSTPVRAVIDRAVALVDRPLSCLALVTTQSGVSGLFFGPVRGAWREAARLSACKHVVYLDRPVQRVLSIMPDMYDDLWTAAKGMYKLEPVVADFGEIVIYAPHITEVSYTHGRVLDEIGYHCRDYFLGQWDRFSGYPGGVLAHSTHLTGLGRYDASTGVETPRIRVTLATGIPEERCRRINLGYLDPSRVRMEEWTGREHEGVLVVPRAGEMLYRLRDLETSGVRREAHDIACQEHEYEL